MTKIVKRYLFMNELFRATMGSEEVDWIGVDFMKMMDYKVVMVNE